MSESHGVLAPSGQQRQRLACTDELRLTELCCDALQQLAPPSYPVGRARLSTISADSAPGNTPSERPQQQPAVRPEVLRGGRCARAAFVQLVDRALVLLRPSRSRVDRGSNVAKRKADITRET
jgi:hypothetical protein